MPLTSHFTTMSLIAFRPQLLIFYFLSSGQFGYVNPESFNCWFRCTIGFLLLISLALRGYILSKVKLSYFLKCPKLSFQRQYKIFCSKNVISEYNTNGVIKSQGFNCNHHNMKIYSNTAHLSTSFLTILRKQLPWQLLAQITTNSDGSCERTYMYETHMPK
jgi:hypothetical protein